MAYTKTKVDVASRSEKKANSRAWGVVVLLLLLFTLNFADKAVIGFAATQLTETYGLTPGQYGLVSSAFFWLFAAGAIILTALSRKFSYTWVSGFLMISWLLTMLPLTVPTTFGVLIVCRVLLGFFEGPALAITQSIVHGLFPPEKRATAGAIVDSGANLGPLISAPILTWVILTWGWNAAFIVLSAASAIWVIVWFLYVDRLPLRVPKLTTEPAEEKKKADPNGDIVVPFFRLLMLPSFWGLALLTFAGYTVTSLKVSWLPVFMNKGLGYSQELVGNLMTIPYATAIIVLLGTGALSGRMLRRGSSSRVARGLVTSITLVIGGLAMIAFTLVQPGSLQLVLVVIAFSVNSVAFVVAFAGVSDFLPAHQRVAFFGCAVAIYSLAGIFAPYVLGLIVEAAPDLVHGYANGFLVVGIGVCVTSVLGGFMLNPAKARKKLEKLTIMYATRKDQQRVA
ncbi:MFS transporter [Streptomyces sp. NPDC055078]